MLKHPASSTTNLTGADFINIFGKKRMAKSAKLSADCRKNQNTLRRKSSKLVLAYGNQQKAALCHSCEKAAHNYVDEIDACCQCH
jgi:hypothetical protein